MRTVSFSALAITLGFAGTAFAQGGLGGAGMPSEDEIRAKVQQVLDASPEAIIEIEGIVKITYKAIPTDPAKVAELLGQQMQGGQQLPPGMDIEQLAKQYAPQITVFLNEALTNLGTFEALVPLKVKSKRIPVGKWPMGIEFDGDRPAAIAIRGTEDEPLPDDNKPIGLRLKTRGADIQPELVMEFKEPKRQKEGKEKFEIDLKFLRFQARTRTKVERAPEEE
jgi:hypothetical protein